MQAGYTPYARRPVRGRDMELISMRSFRRAAVKGQAGAASASWFGCRTTDHERGVVDPGAWGGAALARRRSEKGKGGST